MNRIDRVRAAFRGEPVDRVPVALWRHFPEQDQTPEGLAQAVTSWQRQYDWDLAKITPTSGYPYEDWGARFTYTPNAHGTREVVDRPVKTRADWATVRPRDVREGVLGREVQATRLIVRALHGQTPVFQTLFSPSYTTSNLAGEQRFLEDIRQVPQAVRPAMEAVTETTIALARAFLEAGVDGLFFATQLACQARLSEEEYRRLAEPYDRAVLEAVKERSAMVLLHAHGEEIYFDLLARYPADALNWHDRATPPTLAEGQQRFPGGVVGGIAEETLLRGTTEEVAEQVHAALRETAGRRVLIATGCVAPVVTPEANLRAARAAVEA